MDRCMLWNIAHNAAATLKTRYSCRCKVTPTRELLVRQLDEEMTHTRHCGPAGWALCYRSHSGAGWHDHSKRSFPIKDTSMSQLRAALPVLLATRKSQHMCRWCSPIAGLAYECIWNTTYLFAALRETHCIPPSPTRTFLFPDSSAPLSSCLSHTFVCPVYPDRTLSRSGVKMRDLRRCGG